LESIAAIRVLQLRSAERTHSNEPSSKIADPGAIQLITANQKQKPSPGEMTVKRFVHGVAGLQDVIRPPHS